MAPAVSAVGLLAVAAMCQPAAEPVSPQVWITKKPTLNGPTSEGAGRALATASEDALHVPSTATKKWR